jgi:hypothetical protein
MPTDPSLIAEMLEALRLVIAASEDRMPGNFSDVIKTVRDAIAKAELRLAN